MGAMCQVLESAHVALRVVLSALGTADLNVVADRGYLDKAPDSMHIRRQTVEHPFGTLKVWMGATVLIAAMVA